MQGAQKMRQVRPAVYDHSPRGDVGRELHSVVIIITIVFELRS